MPRNLKPEQVQAKKRELQLLSRATLDEHYERVVTSILTMGDTLVNAKGDISLEPMRLKLDCLKWLADRGHGKAPLVVRVGTDEGTPESILNEIARKRTEEYLARMEAEAMKATAITSEVETET